MNLSSSIVSLLIALVSVIALSAQNISEVFDIGDSNVRIAVVSSSEGLISLLAVNDGNRSGAITPAELDVYDSRYGNAQYVMAPKDNSFIVEAGKVKQIDLQFEQTDTVARHKRRVEEGTRNNIIDPKKKFNTDCKLEISIVQHGGFRGFFDAQESKINREQRDAARGVVSKTKDMELPIELPHRKHVNLSNIDCYRVFPWLAKQRFSVVQEED